MRRPRADALHSALTPEQKDFDRAELAGTPLTLASENPPIQGRQSLPLDLTIVTLGEMMPAAPNAIRWWPRVPHEGATQPY
jgi:hypothetical protein